MNFVGAHHKAVKDPRSRLSHSLQFTCDLRQKQSMPVDVVHILGLTDKHLVKLRHQKLADHVHVTKFSVGPVSKETAHFGEFGKGLSSDSQPFLVSVYTHHSSLDEISQGRGDFLQNLQEQRARNRRLAELLSGCVQRGKPALSSALPGRPRACQRLGKAIACIQISTARS